MNPETASLLALLPLVLPLHPTAALPATSPTTWYVDVANCPGPGEGTLVNPFCSIQDAIDNAVAGDTVRVAAGVYHEGITLKSDVDVLGEDPETTILTSSSEEGDVVTAISVTNATFAGFQVTGARDTSIPGGAGVFVNFPDASFVIEDLIVLENDNGIVVFNSYLRTGPTIRDCDVHHNDYVGIFCPGEGPIRTCRIWRNGTGVLLDGNSTGARITRCTIWGNDLYGIEYWNDIPGVFTNNLIAENGVYGIYESYAVSLSPPFVQGNLFWNNGTANYLAIGGGPLNTAEEINSQLRAGQNLVDDPLLCGPFGTFGVCATSAAIGGGLNGVTIGAEGAACGAPYAAYGAGLAGTGALEPLLAGGGCSSPGFPILALIANGRGGALGILGVSLTQAALPFRGGTLLLAPPVLRAPHALSGTPGAAGVGTASVEVPIPPDPDLIGLAVHLQALYLDPAAPQGVSMTAGLVASVQ